MYSSPNQNSKPRLTENTKEISANPLLQPLRQKWPQTNLEMNMNTMTPPPHSLHQWTRRPISHLTRTTAGCVRQLYEGSVGLELKALLLRKIRMTLIWTSDSQCCTWYWRSRFTRKVILDSFLIVSCNWIRLTIMGLLFELSPRSGMEFSPWGRLPLQVPRSSRIITTMAASHVSCEMAHAVQHVIVLSGNKIIPM